MDNRKLVERLKWPLVTVEIRPMPIAGPMTMTPMTIGQTSRPILDDAAARGDMALAAARIGVLEDEIARLRRELDSRKTVLRWPPMTRPLNPLPGDINLLRDYPDGTPDHMITDFEVWDGQQWIHAQHQPTYRVEVTGSAENQP